MAQENPEHTEHEPEAWTATTRTGGGINPENQSQEPFSQLRPAGPAVRSSPIAIVRTPEGQGDDSSSEEDGDRTIEANMDGLKIAGNDRAYSRSLPNHLLRAPRLGSVPSNDVDYWIDRHPTMLPPAAKSGESTSRSSSSKGGPSLLSGGDDRHTSYGSLRESHMRGRFLDGPSSYRDRTTGDIRSLQHRVRFQEGSVASSLPPSLSIGERIMKSRKEQASGREGGSSSSKDKGSLTALLEAADTEPEPNTKTEELPVKARTPTFYEEEQEHSLPSHMLSTSLTGLEILQAGLRVGPVAGDQDASSAGENETHSPALFGNTEALPLNARGRNALLTRSTSDPFPQGHPRVPVAAASPLLLSMHNSNASTPNRSNRTTSNNVPTSNVPPPLSLDLSSLSASTAADTATNAQRPLFQSAAIAGAAPVTSYQMQVHDRRVEQELDDAAAAATNMNANPSDHDPDTDFAFDLELE